MVLMDIIYSSLALTGAFLMIVLIFFIAHKIKNRHLQARKKQMNISASGTQPYFHNSRDLQPRYNVRQNEYLQMRNDYSRTNYSDNYSSYRSRYPALFGPNAYSIDERIQ